MSGQVPARRALLQGGAALALSLMLPRHAAAQGRGELVVVNIAGVLENAQAARRLAAAESEARAAVEAHLERVKQELEAEEQALTELRASLPAPEFATRSAAFDRRVRAERRGAQERGAELLRFLEEGRSQLRRILPEALEALRRERGVALVLDAAAAAAWDPDLDATADAAVIFDRIAEDLVFTPPPSLLER